LFDSYFKSSKSTSDNVSNSKKPKSSAVKNTGTAIWIPLNPNKLKYTIKASRKANASEVTN